MKPEELKIIAEGMGYIFSHILGGLVYVTVINPPHDHYFIPYSPLTNDTRCMEIMEKLLTKGCVEIDKPFSRVSLSFAGTTYYGKTINEAVCKAALEYFKEAK